MFSNNQAIPDAVTERGNSKTVVFSQTFLVSPYIAGAEHHIIVYICNVQYFSGELLLHFHVSTGLRGFFASGWNIFDTGVLIGVHVCMPAREWHGTD